MSSRRLFYIGGVRHSAVVIAMSEGEAVDLAVEAAKLGKGDAKVPLW